MNRRTLLQNLAYGFGAAVLMNNMSSVGEASGKRKLSKIGLQFYTVRKNMELDFEGTLRRIAALGIKQVEFAGYFNQPPEQIKNFSKP